jgi:hypothetical protein
MKPDKLNLSLASSSPSVASGMSELMGWWEGEKH